jgi:hypothetical protein
VPRKEDFELFGLSSGKFLASAFEQRLYVETGAVVRHVNPLDRNAGEWNGIRKLNQVANPGDDLRTEE